MRNLIAHYCARYPRNRGLASYRPYAAVPFTPPPPAYPVPPKAAMVRPYVLASERQRQQRRTDRTRLGVAVLLDIARPLEVVG